MRYELTVADIPLGLRRVLKCGLEPDEELTDLVER